MYEPAPNLEGFALVLAALSDYLAADTQLMSLLAPAGDDGISIYPEGTITGSTPTPFVMFTVQGDSTTGAGDGDHLLRLIVYAMDRERGYMRIERILSRLQFLFNNSSAVMEFMTFPPDVYPMVLNLRDVGGTQSESYAKWNVEARGRYVHIDLMGVPTSD